MTLKELYNQLLEKYPETNFAIYNENNELILNENNVQITEEIIEKYGDRQVIESPVANDFFVIITIYSKFDKQKQFFLNTWEQRDIVNSKLEMLSLLNILEAHNETLDSIHDVYMGNSEFCCSIFYNMGVSSDRETVQAIFEHNVFYPSYDAMIAAYQEAADEEETTLEEYMELEDIRKTADGFVRVLWY